MTELIDVRHLGRPHVIGCWRVGEVIIDPGPESSLASLLEALGDERPAAVLLTHIHLDHAGGTGALVKRWPDLEVFVHERGAPHLVDPAKLLDSAGRLYGDEMDRLWGDVLPVPEENVSALAGGEQVHGFDVVYTPGHASHHVTYLHRESRRAFVGDTAAVRIPPSDFVLPPTPPPDIDLEAWLSSIDAISDWAPESLGLTHFGAVEDAAGHLDIVRRRLTEAGERARNMTAGEFEAALRADVAAANDAVGAEATLQAVPPEQQYAGLERYWRKRGEQS